MLEMKYKLLKDLPEVKAGSIFEENQKDIFSCSIGNNKSTSYPLDYIKLYPDWFKPIEEPKFTIEEIEKECIRLGWHDLTISIFTKSLLKSKK